MLTYLIGFFFSIATAQEGWNKIVNRSEKGADAFYLKLDEEMLVTEAQYQALNSKTKVSLTFVKKGGDGGQTEHYYMLFKNAKTGTTYKFSLITPGMGGSVSIDGKGDVEYYAEQTFAYNTERIYITPPPMVAYAYYGNNSLPIAQPITKAGCEQQNGEAIWECKGIIPVTKAKCSLLYDATKNTITLTTPKGTKVFKAVEE